MPSLPDLYEFFYPRRSYYEFLKEAYADGKTFSDFVASMAGAIPTPTNKDLDLIYDILPGYDRVSPFLSFGGKVGDVDDEIGLDRFLDTNRNARIVYSPTGGPDGDGGWNFLGGNQGGDCARLTIESTYPMDANEVWTQTRFKVNAFCSIAGKRQILVGVTKGDGANQANAKPVIKLDETGQLWLGDTNSTTHDVVLHTPIALGTVYTVVLHARGGGAGSLTHEAFLYNSLGKLLASASGSWAIGNTGSNNVCKVGNTGGGNTTGLDWDFSHFIGFKDISTNPGPCKVYILDPVSVIAAGNFTFFGAADEVSAITEKNSNFRVITDLASVSGSVNIFSAASANFTNADDGASFTNFSGITNAARRISGNPTDANNASLDSSSGVATAVATTAILQKRGNDADKSYIVVNNATASQIEFNLSDANIPVNDLVHSVRIVINARHVVSAPTIKVGVKIAGTTELLPIFPAMTTQYNRRRGGASVAANADGHNLNPATGLRWTPADIDNLIMIIRDDDALAREGRITKAFAIVVAAQVAA